MNFHINFFTENKRAHRYKILYVYFENQRQFSGLGRSENEQSFQKNDFKSSKIQKQKLDEMFLKFTTFDIYSVEISNILIH